MNIDVVCLTETFIKSGDELNISLKQFRLASYFSRKKEKRGGVSILVRRNLDYNILDICNNYCKEKMFEVCGIQIPLINCIVL